MSATAEEEWVPAFEIARSSPDLEVGQFALSLESLGPTYSTSPEAKEQDWIDERDGHYPEDGELWLRYWFFYYYNDSSVVELETGTHEGDWEMMMMKLDKARGPVEVVYAQHEDGAHCAWGETETTSEGRPIAYVAVGTHATIPIRDHGNCQVALQRMDHADGEGGAVIPLLQPIGDNSPTWVAWPGHWGGTAPEITEEIGEASSPTAPHSIHSGVTQKASPKNQPNVSNDSISSAGPSP